MGRLRAWVSILGDAVPLQRKTTRASWSPDIMRHAVEVVRRGEMGVKRAAKLYSVPVSTLRDKVRSNSNEFTPKLGRNPTLGREFEADLVKYLVKMEARGFGLTRADIRRLTFQFSERNGIAHTFNNNMAMPRKKGETVTVVGCCSASGLYIPPYVVMKGKRMKDEYSDGLPPGSKLSLSDTGYINSDLFLDWLKHFRSFACPGKVLLLVDGHASHAKSVAVLDYARDKDIIMFCLPPHTTKYLQPLDRSVYKPLKVFYQHATHKFVRSQPGSTISKYRFGSLFSEAWGKTATYCGLCSGFFYNGDGEEWVECSECSVWFHVDCMDMVGGRCDDCQ
ncbi:hypothetical protein HOLleu_18284 [Holothuria leucospilota]|uniref:Phorbol-ester/DAG-type domain-containing protein n=1 Tax=Holothuria leucospilota TaxID=206669 RepID=A0A9Q1H6K4_HOLLE|nr:hypothetical protein HOLleu_18284 [Holothuria leucospilota]